jgi:hypothetical protein
MQNEQKYSRNMSSKLILLPVIVLALSSQGCANQEKIPVDVPTQAAAKTAEQQPAAQAENPAPPPAPIIEQYALDRLKQMSDELASTKTISYHSNSFIERQAVTGQFLTFLSTPMLPCSGLINYG